jgi:hypothetical protein
MTQKHVHPAFEASENLVQFIKDKFGYSGEALSIASGLTLDELAGMEQGLAIDAQKMHRLAHAVGLSDPKELL